MLVAKGIHENNGSPKNLQFNLNIIRVDLCVGLKFFVIYILKDYKYLLRGFKANI